MSGIKRASRPWHHDLSAGDAYEQKQKGVLVVRDPSDMYDGYLTYLSWQMSCVQHIDRHRIPSPDDQVFVDGTQFVIDLYKPRRVHREVEIRDGVATDVETGEVLMMRNKMPRWCKFSR
jgi:hypothetical protein